MSREDIEITKRLAREAGMAGMLTDVVTTIDELNLFRHLAIAEFLQRTGQQEIKPVRHGGVLTAPWPDFAGNPIHEGDTIRHPSGEEGRVLFFEGLDITDNLGDAWRVDYGTGYVLRLCLQIGDKGQAVVVKKVRA